MSVLLFVVDETFMLTRIGLTLVPGLTPGGPAARTGSKVRLVRPDGSTVLTTIHGIQWAQPDAAKGDLTMPISLGNDLTKEDVPKGTQVWLDER